MHARAEQDDRSPDAADAGTRASDVIFDDPELARRARTTLAGAEAGLVWSIDGRGVSRRGQVTAIFDDGGEPVVLLPNHGPLAHAGATRRLVGLEVCPPWRGGVRLRFAGRLARLDEQSRWARLAVDDVSVGCPLDLAPCLHSYRRLPLSLYALSRPDELAAHSPRLAHYLNEHCADQLRRWVALATGGPDRDLGAAFIAQLEPAAVTMRYVDRDGGHVARLPLDPPATSLPELAALLRERLQSAATAHPGE